MYHLSLMSVASYFVLKRMFSSFVFIRVVNILVFHNFVQRTCIGAGKPKSTLRDLVVIVVVVVIVIIY
jgi:hypothetical protein